MNDNIFELLKCQSSKIERKGAYDGCIEDQKYRNFVIEYNGGYFFNNSLHVYGVNDMVKYHDRDSIQLEIERNYGDLVTELYFFAEDAFGNQFAFGEQGKVYLYNIESAEKEFIAKNFEEWLILIFEDQDYLTGESLVLELSSNKIDDMAQGFRLCPKYPFILGGEYNSINLYLKFYIENLKYNSNLAKQVVNLEDGQSINLKIL